MYSYSVRVFTLMKRDRFLEITTDPLICESVRKNTVYSLSDCILSVLLIEMFVLKQR